jgi:hypothetical protein
MIYRFLTMAEVAVHRAEEEYRTKMRSHMDKPWMDGKVLEIHHKRHLQKAIDVIEKEFQEVDTYTVIYNMQNRITLVYRQLSQEFEKKLLEKAWMDLVDKLEAKYRNASRSPPMEDSEVDENESEFESLSQQLMKAAFDVFEKEHEEFHDEESTLDGMQNNVFLTKRQEFEKIKIIGKRKLKKAWMDLRLAEELLKKHQDAKRSRMDDALVVERETEKLHRKLMGEAVNAVVKEFGDGEIEDEEPFLIRGIQNRIYQYLSDNFKKNNIEEKLMKATKDSLHEINQYRIKMKTKLATLNSRENFDEARSGHGHCKTEVFREFAYNNQDVCVDFWDELTRRIDNEFSQIK